MYFYKDKPKGVEHMPKFNEKEVTQEELEKLKEEAKKKGLKVEEVSKDVYKTRLDG